MERKQTSLGKGSAGKGRRYVHHKENVSCLSCREVRLILLPPVSFSFSHREKCISLIFSTALEPFFWSSIITCQVWLDTSSLTWNQMILKVAKPEREKKLQCHPVTIKLILYGQSHLLRGNLPQKALPQIWGIYRTFFSKGFFTIYKDLRSYSVSLL